MIVPGRHETYSEGYRYGFNGNEKDDEIKGESKSYDFGARVYDPRIGLFLSRDPKWREYIFQSPYAFAINSPIRYIDLLGEGPGDRIMAALQYLKTPYLQQGNEKQLRTGTSKEALEFMDCSELICRVLAADEFTDGVQYMVTSNFTLQTWLKSNWKEVETPKKGDIIIWNGHTALVTADYEEGKKINVVHATKYGNVSSVIEEKYAMSYYAKKGAKFYTPIVDKPDGDLGKPAGSNATSKDQQEKFSSSVKSDLIEEIPVIVKDNVRVVRPQINLHLSKTTSTLELPKDVQLKLKIKLQGKPENTIPRTNNSQSQ